MAEFDVVALTVDLPEYKLKVGDVGTVVDITPNGRQYTLEFFNYAGATIAVVSVQPSQVRPISPEREITSVRVLGECRAKQDAHRRFRVEVWQILPPPCGY